MVGIFVHLRRKKLDSLIRETIEGLKKEGVDIDEVFLKLEYLNDVQKRIAAELGNAVFTIN